MVAMDTSQQKNNSQSLPEPPKRRVRRLVNESQNTSNPLLRQWDSTRDDNLELKDNVNAAPKNSPSKRRHQTREQASDTAECNILPVQGLLLLGLQQTRRSVQTADCQIHFDSTELRRATMPLSPSSQMLNNKDERLETQKRAQSNNLDHLIHSISQQNTFAAAQLPLLFHSNQSLIKEQFDTFVAEDASRQKKRIKDSPGDSSADQPHSKLSDYDRLVGQNLPLAVLQPFHREIRGSTRSGTIPRPEQGLCARPPSRSLENRETKISSVCDAVKIASGLDVQYPKPEHVDLDVQNLAQTLSEIQLELQDFCDKKYDLDRNEKSPSRPQTLPLQTPKSTGIVSQRKCLETPNLNLVKEIGWIRGSEKDCSDQGSLSTKKGLHAETQRSIKLQSQKHTKKAFQATKQIRAMDFLMELDTEITSGKIAELAQSTGGVKLVWTKKLNTTAGRANWKRETILARQSGCSEPVTMSYKHHVSIELAEKVIDNEHRLFNVLAHEFCHLANFMINGITNSPHGKEFKVWAAKCSDKFSKQGIHVTTKHSYEIDFKYIWECTACGSEYKRHSKSINLQKHRCGCCKSLLKQIKPIPRAPSGTTKQSQYQVFLKEHMSIVRSENPGAPQKDVMKILGDRWAKRDCQDGNNGKDQKARVVCQPVDLP